MFKRYLLLVMLCLTIFSLVPLTTSAATPPTAVGKLGAIEEELYGTEQAGALIERVSRLEFDLYSESHSQPILERIDQMYVDVKGNEETHAPTFVSRLNAVEWMFTKAITKRPSKTRLEELEKMIAGDVSVGGLMGRLNALLAMVYTQGDIAVEHTTLPKDSLIKVSLLQEVNGKLAREGDIIQFRAEENIFVGNLLIVPKGATGEATIVKIKHASNFGRDGRVDMDFKALLTIDGTIVPLYLGELAKKATESQIAAAGASAAGMLVFGPVGAIGGLFVHGKEAVIPVGTVFYTQVKEDVGLNGLVRQNQIADSLDKFIEQNK